jgi:hypothetical protein
MYMHELPFEGSAALGTDTRAEGKHNSQVLLLRRRLGRLLNRFRQSRRGFGVAADAASADSPPVAERLAAKGRSRHAQWDRLRGLTGLLGRGSRPLLHQDVAGAIHRWWIRIIGRTGAAGVLDECDRGESALLKEVDRVLAAVVRGRLHEYLTMIHRDIESTLKVIRSERRRIDVGLPGVGSRRLRGSANPFHEREPEDH